MRLANNFEWAAIRKLNSKKTYSYVCSDIMHSSIHICKLNVNYTGVLAWVVQSVNGCSYWNELENKREMNSVSHRITENGVDMRYNLAFDRLCCAEFNHTEKTTLHKLFFHFKLPDLLLYNNFLCTDRKKSESIDSHRIRRSVRKDIMNTQCSSAYILFIFVH